jgi:hypothetical protein
VRDHTSPEANGASCVRPAAGRTLRRATLAYLVSGDDGHASVDRPEAERDVTQFADISDSLDNAEPSVKRHSPNMRNLRIPRQRDAPALERFVTYTSPDGRVPRKARDS